MIWVSRLQRPCNPLKLSYQNNWNLKHSLLEPFSAMIVERTLEILMDEASVDMKCYGCRCSAIEEPDGCHSTIMHYQYR
jgi:hypothetical protein